MDLLEYVATAVAEATGGTYSPTDPVTPSAIAPTVFQGMIPEGFPYGVAIIPYAVNNQAYLAADIEGMQLRYRGTFNQVMDMRDAVFDRLQGLYFVAAQPGSTFRIEQVSRQSSGSLGYDGRQLLNWSENYYFQVHQPTTHRL